MEGISIRPVRHAAISGRRISPALRVVLCFVFNGFATALPCLRSLGDSVWVANGLLLSYLLLSPRWRWKAYFLAGFAAQCVSGLLVHELGWQINLVMTTLNMVEVALAALLLRGRTGHLPSFTDRTLLTRFVAFAVVAAPLGTGLIFAPIAHFFFHLPFGPSLRDWFLTDALGMAVTVPAVVAIFRTRLFPRPVAGRDFLPLVLLLVVTPVLFHQTQLPAMSLVFPVLILIELRLGLGWAALSTLAVAAIGSAISMHAAPSARTSIPIGSIGPSLRLQLFVASAMFMLYSISVVVDNLRKTQDKLQKIAYLHELVTQNSRDLIILADFEGNRSYVSASAAHFGGWKPEQILARKSLDLVHPEDRRRVAELLRQLHAGLDGALLECRVADSEGNYRWVEASLRTIRDPITGAPTGLLNMVRDIAARKRAEQELQAAYRAMEEMAVVDALTGLANRRRFDESFATEWRRALREREPLSMILMDVDLFKSYNDRFGHVRGDSCLRQVAESALDVVTRPGDLVARFGGEEFTVILPNTDHRGALKVANEIRQSLERRRLDHPDSPHAVVTLSAGCATLIPVAGQKLTDLIEIADCALYRAKHQGRNLVCGNPDQALIPDKAPAACAATDSDTAGLAATSNLPTAPCSGTIET